MNRKIAPSIVSPKTLPDFHILTSGDKVIFHEMETEEELVRLSLLFESGSVYENQPGQAHALSRLLLSGTSKYSPAYIQEKLDYFGSYLDIDQGIYEIHIQIFSLRKFLLHTLEFLCEVLSDLKIDETEFQVYLNRSIEGLKVNKQKTAYLSKVAFNQRLFGKESIYGRALSEEDFQSLSMGVIHHFYQINFLKGLTRVLSNVRLGREEKQLLLPFSRETFDRKTLLSRKSYESGEFRVEKSGSVQSTICCGLLTVNRKHPDFPILSVMNTLLGGYFGSRLMKNIREEKGYTYGIHSSIQNLPDTGVFVIKTDVGKEVTSSAVHEIFEEIKRLKSEVVSPDELETVKNYMLGSLQRSFDGSLAMLDRFKVLLDFDLNNDYYQTMMQHIREVKASDIRIIAEKYLLENQFITVISGEFD